MSINDYSTKLKRLADQLCDIGHPVFEPSQVLNLLRGLSPKYRYVKPVITSKYPPHSFQSARFFLILEELSAQHDANTEAGQALTVTHGDNNNHGSSNSVHGGNKDGSSSSTAPRTNSGGNNRFNRHQDRQHGCGHGNGGALRSNNPNSTTQSAPWAVGYNPWKGMVQA
ncbi:uncharacterized protein [Miscanthus floridulus]|uniref:uncharacterized protein n=1 Tax=Miscanthus floridulus TaxID=154761 RepID=UPI00345A5428